MEALDALERRDSPDARGAGPLGVEVERGVLVARASAWMGLERYDEAIRPLQTFLEANPEGVDAPKCRAQLAVSLARLERLEEADPVYDTFRETCQDRSLLLQTTLYLADANARRGRTSRARQLYLVLADKKNPAGIVAKGLAALARLDSDTNDSSAPSEDRTFGQLLDEFADSPAAAGAALTHAAALERRQRVDEAIDAYRLVYERFPESAEAPQACLAAAQLLQSRKQLEAAEKVLREAGSKYPDYQRSDAVHYLWAWTLVDLGRPEEADEVFQRLAEKFPGSTYWADATYRLAERAARRGDLEQADQLAGQLIQADSAGKVRGHALYMRGQVAAASGRWEAVETFMGRLVRELPNSELILPAEYWRAEAAYRTAKFDVAEQRFRTLAQSTDGRSEAWLAMISLRRAQMLARKHQWTEARELAESIVERFPGFRQQYEVDYLLGRCSSSRGKFTDARSAYERVVRSPEGGRTETAAMAQWMIGETYFHQKEYGPAIKAYHRVETLYAFPRWQAAALLQAGKCYEMQSNWHESVKLYAQLLKDYPETRFQQEASRRLRKAKLQAPRVVPR